MAQRELFSDDFTINSVNQFQYDRVSRITALSSDGSKLVLDVNHELFPVFVEDRMTLTLAHTLNADGSKSEAGWRDMGNEPTLADSYDYVCHGKVYHFKDSESNKDHLTVYVSYGGLLMEMSGPYNKLSPLKIDYVYLLLKR